MQRLAEARKYAQEYVIRKCEEVQRFNEFTVETDEEAASVIHHMRLAYSAAVSLGEDRLVRVLGCVGCRVSERYRSLVGCAETRGHGAADGA